MDLDIKTLFLNEKRRHGKHNTIIILHTKKSNRHKKRKDLKLFWYNDDAILSGPQFSIDTTYSARKLHSIPNFRDEFKKVKEKRSYSLTHVNQNKTYKSVAQRRKHYNSSYNENLFTTLRKSVRLHIYRCQLTDDSCCCSCNSEAMFEVMKGLYDCYKKKNCDDCNCILCGHIPPEERHLGEVKKSIAAITGPAAVKARKEMAKKATEALIGKSPQEKEKILKELAARGAPLPEGKTDSEKELIRKIKNEMGLPAEPKTPAEKERLKKAEEAGLIVPLQGKSAAQKDKILRQQIKLGVPLPVGRTASEKALIEKAKEGVAVGFLGKGIPPEKLNKARAAGLLTPLEYKTPEQKEKLLRGLAQNGIPLPEGKTASDKKLIEKVRADLGLPPVPKSEKEKGKYVRAFKNGIITPLEGKSPSQKELILKREAEVGISLPEGRTPSEKALIKSIVTAPPPSPLSKVTPSKVKTPEQKEKILRGLVANHIPLPEGKTASEKKLIDKIRADLGLPPTPKSASDKEKYNKAVTDGLITPLKGKTIAQKEKILKAQFDAGLPLPEGKTPSEKALIKKIQAKEKKAKSVVSIISEKIKKVTAKEKKEAPPAKEPSEKLRKAKEAGLIKPAKEETQAEREKVLRGLALKGLPLPEGKTPSEKKMIEKVRRDMGLPPEPTTSAMKIKYKTAQDDGLIIPLEGKKAAQKEKILRAQAKAGLILPEGRTASEKKLIDKIIAEKEAVPPAKAPSEKLRKATEAGLIKPAKEETQAEREKVLRGLALKGLPLPEGKSPSEKKLIEKVRRDMGLPPGPTTSSMKTKYGKAQDDGLIIPLEGRKAAQKEKILRAQAKAGLILPEGRTASEKKLIDKVKAEAEAVPPAKVPSEKLRKAKEAGLIKPAKEEPQAQREKVLRGLALKGLPLPEGKTPSDKKLIDKVRRDMGLPPEPTTSAMKTTYAKAQADGLIIPLEGKKTAQKEKILRAQAKAGLILPEGRTASEKKLIDKVKADISAKPSKELGTALSAKARMLDQKTRKVMKEGKGPSDECICGILTPESEKVSMKKIPSATPSQKEAKEPKKAKESKAIKPSKAETQAQREKVLRGLALKGLPLPEGKTPSEKNLIEKVRRDIGLPPGPTTSSMKTKYEKAQADGLIIPLEGRKAAQKEKLLRAQAKAGLILPEGRTASEKKLIDKVKAEAEAVPPAKVPSEKLRKATEAGLIKPAKEETQAEREKVLRGLALKGLPLPEGKSPSEKKLIEKVRRDMGLPPGPTTSSMKTKYEKAQDDGLIIPLEGKKAAQKEKILRAQAKAGLILPEGRTASEKKLIDKIKAEAEAVPPAKVPSEKLRKAKEAGLIKPSKEETQAQREKVMRGLALKGLPLPEGKTPSEKKLIDKVRRDMGLPPEPTTSAMKTTYAKAQTDGLIIPLEGKKAAQKEKILKAQAKAGLILPEGRTASEKKLIDKVKAEISAKPSKELGPALSAKARMLDQKTRKVMKEGKGPSDECICGILTPESEKKSMKKIPSATPSQKEAKEPKKAKEGEAIKPSKAETQAQREKVLRNLALKGLPLPEGKTPSEKNLIEKVRRDIGLPPGPTTSAMKTKYEKAQADGLIIPLEGKKAAQKEKILRAQAKAGLILPEGRTASEKKLIDKIIAEKEAVPPAKVPSEKLRKATEAGLIKPSKEETQAQREKVLRGLALKGLPLPEGKSPSEKKLIEKVRRDMGLPPEPTTSAMKTTYAKAQADGLIIPLEGKKAAQKEKILKAQAKAGLILPEGRTASEKKLIDKVKAEISAKPSKELGPVLSAKAKMLDQKTRKVMKEGKGPSDECICGILTPESEKVSMKKIPSATPSQKEAKEPKKAKESEVIKPSKAETQAQREKVLRGLALKGLPLPEGKTPSEKNLIEKVRRDMGLPPGPTTSSMKTKYEKAQDDGLIIPLEGKKAAQKEKILRAQAKAGLILPEGRTASEKKLIEKIKAEAEAVPPAKVPSEKLRKAKEAELPPAKVPSEKLRKAKEAGLIKPSKEETQAEREKVLRGLALNGLPLPEGKTPSDKKLIEKVRRDMGLPPGPTTSSMKTKYEKAQGDGLIIPLEGKKAAQKEKILRALAKAGLILPEGRTASEKKLIEKIKAEAEAVPPAKVPSEKLRKAKEAELPPAKVKPEKPPEITASKKMLTTSKKIGIGDIEKKTEKKKKEVGVKSKAGKEEADKEVGIKPQAGIVEGTDQVLKKSTCERACGCDKKKIKFKHSYVKIKITSPEISSLCPCPEECVPHVKSGVIIDKEGINVTVGSVVGFPSYTSIKYKDYKNKTLLNDTSSHSTHTSYVIEEIYSNVLSLKTQNLSEDLGERQNYRNDYFYKYMINQLKKYEECKGKMSNNEICETESLQSYTHDPNVYRSMESIESSLSISSTESSLSFSASVTSSIDTKDIISVSSSSICTSSHYLAYRETSSSDSFNHEHSENTSNDNLLVTKSSEKVVLIGNSKNKPIIILNRVTNSRELMKIVKEIMSKQKTDNASSVIVVASSSYDEMPETISKTESSTICIRLPKNYFNKNHSNTVVKTNFECTILKAPQYGGHGLKHTSKNGHDPLSTLMASCSQGVRTFTETNFEREMKSAVRVKVKDVAKQTVRPNSKIKSLLRAALDTPKYSTISMDPLQDGLCCYPKQSTKRVSCTSMMTKR